MNEAPPVLETYSLGRVNFEPLLALQRRLVYEISGERSRGVLLLCEFPGMISIGRDGSRAHVLYETSELHARGWPIKWVNRGGGCILHVPGQLQIIGIVPIDRHGLNLNQYVDRLHEILLPVCQDCDAPAALRTGRPGIWVGRRMVAHIGIAVHDWVAYFGASLNIDPDLDLFRRVHCDGDPMPMTSIARERRAHVRAPEIRQRIIEEFSEQFHFRRVAVFHRHPSLEPAPVHHELAYRSA